MRRHPALPTPSCSLLTSLPRFLTIRCGGGPQHHADPRRHPPEAAASCSLRHLEQNHALRFLQLLRDARSHCQCLHQPKQFLFSHDSSVKEWSQCLGQFLSLLVISPRTHKLGADPRKLWISCNTIHWEGASEDILWDAAGERGGGASVTFITYSVQSPTYTWTALVRPDMDVCHGISSCIHHFPGRVRHSVCPHVWVPSVRKVFPLAYG